MTPSAISFVQLDPVNGDGFVHKWIVLRVSRRAGGFGFGFLDSAYAPDKNAQPLPVGVPSQLVLALAVRLHK